MKAEAESSEVVRCKVHGPVIRHLQLTPACGDKNTHNCKRLLSVVNGVVKGLLMPVHVVFLL